MSTASSSVVIVIIVRRGSGRSEVCGRCCVLALGETANLQSLCHSNELLQIVIADVHLAQVHVLQNRLEDVEFNVVHVEHGMFAGIRLEEEEEEERS